MFKCVELRDNCVFIIVGMVLGAIGINSGFVCGIIPS